MKTKRSLATTVLTAAFALALIIGGLLGTVPAYAQTTSDGLTANEVEGLQFMLEEEKLARDVYLALDEQWALPIFHNISRAEQTHMDAVASLLERHGVDADLSDGPLGRFANQDLQALYDQLTASGSQSMVDALLVGMAIEEIDIIDLQEQLTETENADIQLVYANLLRGSGNHLRAFVSNLERQTGETALPQYMEQDNFDEIMDGGNGRKGNGFNDGGQRDGQKGSQRGNRGDRGPGGGQARRQGA